MGQQARIVIGLLPDDVMTQPAVLRSELLPRFTFIAEDGSEETVALPGETARIRAAAAILSARVARGAIVGLIFKTGKELTLDWLACLLAGLRPLVMQYPTKKQSHLYWSDSVRNTISVAGMAALICDEHCARLIAESQIAVAVIPAAELAAAPATDGAPFALDSFSIIQLSSGTTGHRKAIEFRADQLLVHAQDYNKVLALGASDTIVSWLPLYHDMGYIGCFVMPMIFGIDVAMMDPMTWIRRPEWLFDAIARHAGTVCYMPNFGFEVMARLEGRPLPTMRWWISCSEPVSAETSQKFIARIGAAPESFAPCYAMAENVFAVSIRRGLKTSRIDQADVVSCGTPIPGTDVKIVDDQVWVRSPASLVTYLGGTDIRDADGFYPTGDLGRLIDGELHITGRAQDLLIQAGQKFMLSDIDLALNQLHPWIRGRAAAVQTYDERLGTQKPVALIETADFFVRNDQMAIAQGLRDTTGLDQIEVQFVPPRFLTKTSSGKFNRKKSASDWLAVQRARESRRANVADPMAELRDAFGQADWKKPVEEVLDSLSLEVLRIILTGTGVRYDGTRALDDVAAALRARKADAGEAAPDTIKIVSLADRAIFRNLEEEHLDRLAALLGAPVTFEHLCLPPSPIVLSDLIFYDYFRPRLDVGTWTAVERAFATLASASLIIADDVAEMLIGGGQAYAVLSHNLERDPVADCVAFRWQRYPRHHDEFPLTFVAGADMAFADRTKVLDMLNAYLRKPIFKIATVDGLRGYTQDWDYQPDLGGRIGKKARTLDAEEFVSGLAAWIEKRPAPLEKYPATADARLQMNDLGHFCSHFIDAEAVDKVIAKFDRFCIVGQRSSLPYVRRKLEREGKHYVHATSYAPEMLGRIPRDYDCVLICGAQGEFEIAGPAVALMRASPRWQVQNIEDPEIAGLTFQVKNARCPPSRTDWFYPFELDRAANAKPFIQTRRANHEVKRANRAERDKKKKAWRKRKARKQRRRAEAEA
jgi:acyl-CoA synthetase (AMP-forming)/AMP-acid ligase II